MSQTPTLLSNLWYLVSPGKKLRARALMHKTVLGTPLVLGRTQDDRVFALRDICPHRGMPLCYGRFDGREVECSYHGWRFDPDGKCTHVPSLVEDQPRDISRIRVDAFRCQEVQGNVWVFFGRDAQSSAAADPADIPRVPGFAQGGYQLAQSMLFPCSIDHAVVGLMDPAHGPFVHRSWWWRSEASIHEKSKRFKPSPLGFQMVRHRPSKNSRAYLVLGGVPETEITFRLPGVRIEHVDTGRHQLCGLTAVTPVDEAHTVVHHIMYWTLPWLSALKPLVRPFARAFLNQDRRVVALQQEGLAHNPRLMLINDADMQARWYYKLKEEFAAAQEENRPFTNPVTEQVLRWRS